MRLEKYPALFSCLERVMDERSWTDRMRKLGLSLAQKKFTKDYFQNSSIHAIMNDLEFLCSKIERENDGRNADL